MSIGLQKNFMTGILCGRVCHWYLPLKDEKDKAGAPQQFAAKTPAKEREWAIVRRET